MLVAVHVFKKITDLEGITIEEVTKLGEKWQRTNPQFTSVARIEGLLYICTYFNVHIEIPLSITISSDNQLLCGKCQNILTHCLL